MAEEREEEVVAETPAQQQYSHLLDHEDAGPLLAGFPGWFKGASGFLEVHLTYWLHERGVLFVAMIVQPNNQVRPWLRHWASHTAANVAAENLAGEAEAYLHQMTSGHPMRETEDLDYDDFLAHVKTRMNGEFH